MTAIISCVAKQSTAVPTLEFLLEHDLSTGRQIINRVSGWLSSSDKTVLARLVEDPEDDSAIQQLAGFGTQFDANYANPTKRRLRLVANLTPEAIARIEQCRLTDSKNDVHLNLEIKVQFLVADVQVAQFFTISRDDVVGHVVGPFKVRLDSGREVDARPIVRAYAGRDYRSDTNDGWILSGNNGPAFLSATSSKSQLSHRIHASEWVHEFAPRVGLRARFLVEIPKSDGRLPNAETYVIKAEEAMARWDTKSIFANCRELGVFLDGELRTKLGANSFAYKERWGRAYERFNHRASLDLHLEQIRSTYSGDSTARIDRGDCEALLYSAKILLKYALDLLG